MNSAQPSRSGRFAAALVAAAVLLSSAGVPSLAQETAALLGTVFDPDGQPAVGFTVVFRDAASGKEIRSSASNEAGLYETTVPVGGRYKLQSVIAPDGTLLPVQDVPPIAVSAAGFNRLDVRFLAKTSAEAGAEPATTPVKAETKRRGAVPWWKTKGGIAGIVIGAAAVAAIAAGGGGGSSSPSAP